VILEHALLQIRPGQEAAFEVAFTRARPLIEVQAGMRGLRLQRGVEHPSTYLLLVEWATLEQHTEGFRQSPEYDEWRALLHGFYDPFPAVEHFTAVL
jgi:heme-degrading monooxygenase HmoA